MSKKDNHSPGHVTRLSSDGPAMDQPSLTLILTVMSFLIELVAEVESNSTTQVTVIE